MFKLKLEVLKKHFYFQINKFFLLILCIETRNLTLEFAKILLKLQTKHN